jgi:glycosyltransferase involved in cell wall biosynthesis
MNISVIIPTYNRSSFLENTILSVINQSYQPKQIVVVDDGSTDDTEQNLNSFAGKIKYIKIENNGVSKARNIGIDNSTGELIAFLDSDDLWLTDKISYQVKYLEDNSDVSICQTEETWIRNGRRVNPKLVHKKYSGWIFEKCIPLCIISPSAVMIRRDVFADVGFFDETMPVCEDYDLWLRCSLKYQIVTLLKAKIIKRGGHPGQLSKQWGQDIWRIHSLQKILPLLGNDKNKIDLVTNDILRRAAIVADGARKRGKEELAQEYDRLKMNTSCA